MSISKTNRVKGFKKGVKQGIYNPRNPDKWVITEAFDMKEPGIKYRSSWEKSFCIFADLNDNIIQVNSEGVVVPYISPVDQKVHKYYIDFFIKTKDKTFLVEIKPFNQTIPPKEPKNSSIKSQNVYKNAIKTYMINLAKWESAEKFAKERGAEFIIITEYELGLK